MIRLCLVILLICSSTLYADEAYDAALHYFYDGKVSKAKSVLLDSEIENPLQRNIFLATIYLENKQPKLAFEQLKEMRTALPEQHVYLYYLFFKIALQKNNFSVAKTNIGLIDQQHNSFMSALTRLELADKYLALKQVKLAKENYIYVLKAGADSNLFVRAAKGLIQLGILGKDRDLSLKYYQKLVTYYPENLEDKKLWKSLTKAFGKKLNETDGFVKAEDFWLFCENLMAKKMYKQAELYTKIFIARYPASAYLGDAYALLGLSYYEQLSFGKSAQYLNNVVKKYPETKYFDEAMFTLARSYQRSGLYVNAEQVYLNIVRNYPNSSYAPMAYYFLYSLYQKLEKTDIYFNQYLGEFEQNYRGSIYYNKLIWELSSEKLEKKEWLAALDILKRYSNESSDIETKARILFWQGRCLKYLGQPDEANVAFLACLKEYPYTLYTYRIVSSYLPHEDIKNFVDNDAINMFELDEKIAWLVEVGLGDLAKAELQYNLDLKKGDVDRNIYDLAFTYNKMEQYYDGIKLLRNYFNLNVYPQRDVEIRKEYFKQLYPFAYRPFIKKYSQAFNVDSLLSLALMREESMFHNTIKSRVSAIGLMQLMPYTAKEIAKQLKYGWQGVHVLENENVNIEYGVYYLSKLKSTFNNNHVLMLAAYNAGPRRVKDWMEEYRTNDMDEFVDKIQFDETKNYVQRVQETYWINKLLYEQ